MGNKILTEADRKRSAAPKLAEGLGFRKESTGQKISLERGKSTRSKKNPASARTRAVEPPASRPAVAGGVAKSRPAAASLAPRTAGGLRCTVEA